MLINMKSKSNRISPTLLECEVLKQKLTKAYQAYHGTPEQKEKEKKKKNKTTKDDNRYQKIATYLEDHGNRTVSPSTLQRIWRYKENHSFQEATLNICVQALGYESWVMFSDSISNPDEENFDPYSINVDEMQKDECITIGWKKQNQYCRLKYLGNYEWVILEEQGMSWPNIKDNKFKARYFVLRVILTLNNEGDFGYLNRLFVWPYMKKPTPKQALDLGIVGLY